MRATTHYLSIACGEDRSRRPSKPLPPIDVAVNLFCSWMFEVKDYDASTNNITFGRGGFQGARGNNEGGDFFIENIFEEFGKWWKNTRGPVRNDDSPTLLLPPFFVLDCPLPPAALLRLAPLFQDYQNEFFYDVNTKQLYFFYNGTGAIPATTEFVVPTTRVLFNLTSPQTNPIRGVTFQGLTLTATRYTYMDPHGVPSGGDWALGKARMESHREKWSERGDHFLLTRCPPEEPVSCFFPHSAQLTASLHLPVFCSHC